MVSHTFLLELDAIVPQMLNITDHGPHPGTFEGTDVQWCAIRSWVGNGQGTLCTHVYGSQAKSLWYMYYGLQLHKT